MDQDYMTMRVWKRTHKKLRIIAAHQEEKIVETLDRLVTKELQRIEEEKNSETKKAEQD